MREKEAEVDQQEERNHETKDETQDGKIMKRADTGERTENNLLKENSLNKVKTLQEQEAEEEEDEDKLQSSLTLIILNA